MSIASVSVNPFYGNVTDNGDGTWTFTPAENFHGNDVALTFVVQDNGGTVSATAIVDVLGVNDAPVAGDVDLGQCQAGTERVIFAHELLAFSHDPDGDPLSVTSVSVDPAYGSVEGYGEGSWIFKPTEGFTGDDVAMELHNLFKGFHLLLPVDNGKRLVTYTGDALTSGSSCQLLV